MSTWDDERKKKRFDNVVLATKIEHKIDSKYIVQTKHIYFFESYIKGSYI